MKKLIMILLALLSVQTFAADFVDDINSSTTKRDVGQRVIYEMNIGSFTQAGTFNAAREQLDELRTFGIDVVWLMPIYPRGTSGSPYAATSFQKTNPKYGTIADLKDFVSRAHELGMEVWLDWVPNHTATNAEWVTSHPEYYAKSNGQMIHPNNYGDVWQLDYTNEGLVNAMNDCLKFWIDQADVDGYRCDYISSTRIPASYWETTIPMIKSYKSGKNITFLGEADIAREQTRLKNVGFDYDYAWQFQTNLLNFGGNGTAASTLKNYVNTLINASSSVTFNRMLFITNHDQNFNDGGKTLTQMYGNNRYPLTALLGTVYGMPLIYNGQETGGNQILDYFSDTKINWNTGDNKMRNTLRTLNALKHEVPALSDRNTVTWCTADNNGVLAFTRKQGSSEVLVILNLATTAVTTTISGFTAGEWTLWLNSETVASGVSRTAQTLSASQSFSLEAKGYRVYVNGKAGDDQPPVTHTYNPTLDQEGEISVFFETPNADTYYTWVWGELGGGEEYCVNPSWPGDAMTLMGKAANGSNIYKYILTKTTSVPQYLIISKNNGDVKIYDGVDFVNNGYYVEGSPTPTKVITEIAGGITGDVDGNGKVDVTDVTALINMILGNTAKDFSTGDVNGDGDINVTDVTMVINIILAV